MDWIATILGAVALYLAGNGRSSAWMLGLTSQTLWIIHASRTNQYALALASALYWCVYARNWIRRPRD